VATPRPGEATYAAGSVTASQFHPPPPPPPAPPANKLLAFGFTVGGKKRVLLVNTGDVDLLGVTVVGASGATHSFVDEGHGHGTVATGREAVGATIDIKAYGVSVVSWP
jgi:hypothetical protein